MDCNDIRPLLEANGDGELDPFRQQEVETHLRTCQGCALLAKGLDARRGALAASLPRFAAPQPLRDRIQAQLRKAGRPAGGPLHFWNLGGMAASIAFAVLLGYAWGASRAHTNGLLDEAISDHVRSLQAGHLMDVVSTDQHTVKPWFIGKLDFSPPVVDLADAGFPLAGGRLEQMDGRPAASLVFHRRLHSINLFVWPAAGGAIPARQVGKKGYQAESWSRDGLNFLAVSEIPAPELDQFASTYRDRTR
jgi:anti-sigma factor RsiW